MLTWSTGWIRRNVQSRWAWFHVKQ